MVRQQNGGPGLAFACIILLLHSKSTTSSGPESLSLSNISVVLEQWTPPTIRVTWDYSEPANVREHIEAFRITYHPIKSRFRIIQEVPSSTRNITIDRLDSNTEYQLSIGLLYAEDILEPVSSDVKTNSTQIIRFVSPENEPSRFYRHSYKPMLLRKVTPAKSKLTIEVHEVAIVVCVLLVWFGVIGLFIKKWGKIRAIEPCQSYFANDIYGLPDKAKQMSVCSTLDPLNIANVNQQLQSADSRRSLSAAAGIIRRESTFGSFNQSPSFLSIQRPRINSVFVTPPTRPVTPMHAYSSPFCSMGSYEGSTSRRFKSAEDLRHIVNSFTRRKSTFLMSPIQR
ncbi:hypothetical protein HDE_09857 [Halotydeus destructor]|nr:hypothetical protein HDE_09857 [Halotydeus destructor]